MNPKININCIQINLIHLNKQIINKSKLTRFNFKVNNMKSKRIIRLNQLHTQLDEQLKKIKNGEINQT